MRSFGVLHTQKISIGIKLPFEKSPHVETSVDQKSL